MAKDDFDLHNEAMLPHVQTGTFVLTDKPQAWPTGPIVEPKKWPHAAPSSIAGSVGYPAYWQDFGAPATNDERTAATPRPNPVKVNMPDEPAMKSDIDRLNLEIRRLGDRVDTLMKNVDALIDADTLMKGRLARSELEITTIHKTLDKLEKEQQGQLEDLQALDAQVKHLGADVNEAMRYAREALGDTSFDEKANTDLTKEEEEIVDGLIERSRAPGVQLGPMTEEVKKLDDYLESATPETREELSKLVNEDIGLDDDNDKHPFELRRERGFLWPAEDHVASTFLWHELPKLDHVIRTYAAERGNVIQAGGNIGLFPKFMSPHFDVVYTFEPEPRNFYCLAHNAPEKNIVKVQACLGARPSLASMVLEVGNHGGTYMVHGGDIPVLRLDDFPFQNVSLMYLDIEGYEEAAIIGAVATIAANRPVIVIEDNGLWRDRGFSRAPAEKLLELCPGYRLAEKIQSDQVFVPTERFQFGVNEETAA